MWKYGASNGGVTPVVGEANISLETAASKYAEILEFNWGGEVTTSTIMRTGLHRAAEGVGSPTALTAGTYEENATASVITASQGDHATTRPAIEGGPLWADSWNAHGGVVRWLAAPGEEIIMLGVSTVVLENSVGTALSTYGFVWGER